MAIELSLEHNQQTSVEVFSRTLSVCSLFTVDGSVVMDPDAMQRIQMQCKVLKKSTA